MNSDKTNKYACRAGRFIHQSGGYKAFIPEPLPPNPPLNMDGLQSILSKADRSLGRLDGVVVTLPNPDLFVFMYVRKEAVLSSQIEGTQSSLQDVLAAEAKILDRDRPHDVIEVINYVNAMHYGLNRLDKLPVSVRLIREIHQYLLHETRGNNLTPGELRKSQNWIGNAGCNLSDAYFVPPPPINVPEALSDLEKFIHKKDNIPILIKIGLVHAQFETIHPFLDGNGRMGRLLIAFLLCNKNAVLHKPVLYISHFLKKNRQEYYDKLQAIRDHGYWEQWLEFFLSGIVEVSTQATETAKKILKMREDHRDKITDNFKYMAGDGHRVLEGLYKTPIISVKNISEITGKSFNASNELVTRFQDIGVLTEVTGQSRNRKYVYQEYIDLFQF
uniref:Protein adenylyltransferase n=1 Tax=Candidatus Kentrum sp. TUN TaxID=2126343 RepID=A0A450ZJK0_9GAMM|nr:MAG: Fic family protein [Candidatus Kentron sp. TUN]VFK55973.1 MAG: Fic family protein [Candidatus Kentron sp. TUN]